MKCSKCQNNVSDGLIRCGNCGNPTPAILSYKTVTDYVGSDGKRRVVPDKKPPTTRLKKNDRKLPAGFVHDYTNDSGEGREE